MTTHVPPFYSTIRKRLNLAFMVIHPVGALLTFLYLSVVDPLPTGEASVMPISIPMLTLLAVLLAGMEITSLILERRRETQIQTWYQRLQAGASPTTVPNEVRRRVLNYPFYSTAGAFLMWLISGVVFALLSDPVGLRIFIGIVGVGGVLATPISYFAIEIIWRPVIAVFFAGNTMKGVPAAFHPTVLRRMLVVCLLISIWPSGLLAYLSLERARALLTAPNPQVILDNFVLVVIFILSTTLLSGIGMAVLMTRSITTPLHALQVAMAEVEKNDFNARVMVTTNDELGYLGEHFNLMTNGLRQGELLRNLLNLYVSPEVAREAMEKGALLGGQTALCTVLFSDIRGFTSLSEHMPPAELIEMLNQYMSVMIDATTHCGGFVNKFGGDSLLAVFGTPLNPKPDHAACAIRSALDMRHALSEFNQAQVRLQRPTLRIGIGIATGPVVVGNVGGKGRLEYTVIGDTVNLASRLQDKTKELGVDILLNAEAYLSARESITPNAKELDAILIRGKQDPVKIYQLID
jgi:class 3 adenylate cyclase